MQRFDVCYASRMKGVQEFSRTNTLGADGFINKSLNGIKTQSLAQLATWEKLQRQLFCNRITTFY